MAGNILTRRSRLVTILLILLSLVLLGTVAVLSTAKAYFSIDRSAYILPEELGTWDEIRWGANSDSPIGWANKYPWVWKLLHPQTTSTATGSLDANAAQTSAVAISQMGKDEVEAQALAAAVAAGEIPPLRDNTPRPADPNSPPEKIPRIIHQTWKDDVLPPKWQAVRDECKAIHPDYEYMLWTDFSSRSFIAEHYPWFLSVFDSYPYAIQRADAIRYFVLHKYGGVYMDLDIGCTRRMDPLLRFEVILPETRPVGVSNDLIFSAKGHPFMDQVIHNLITFNHIYLTHYPTVMFSTGPMFVSASYGIFVDAHGAAYPSRPSQPDVGFTGVRILPKSLYGKNALPSEVPDAFFKHYYGSSWHAGDAGFLIFLRDHGRFLMFLGACLVAFGVCRSLLPRLSFTFRKTTTTAGTSTTSSSRRRDRRRGSRSGGGSGSSGGDGSGHWVGLPIQTAPRQRRQGISRAFSHTPDTTLHTPIEEEGEQAEMSLLGPSSSSKSKLTASSSSAAATVLPIASSARSVAAPRPQRLSVPSFFDIDDDESGEDDFESPIARDEQAGLRTVTPTEYAATIATRWGERAANGVLLLPAYALSRIGSPGLGLRRSSSTKPGGGGLESGSLTGSSALHSPTGSWSSSGSGSGSNSGSGRRQGSSALNVLGWATQLLPAGWKGPISRGKTPLGDLEGGEEEEGEETPLTNSAALGSLLPGPGGEPAGSRRESSTSDWPSSDRRRSSAWLSTSDYPTSAPVPSGADSSRGELLLDHDLLTPMPRSAPPAGGGGGGGGSYPAEDADGDVDGDGEGFPPSAALPLPSQSTGSSSSTSGYFRTPPPPYFEKS